MTFLQETKTKCTQCCAPQVDRLLWKEVDKAEFMPFEKFRIGGLYACRGCMNFWYLNEDETILTHTNNVARLREWANLDFHLPAVLKEKLAAIGANPLRRYGWIRDEEEVTFPCRVITKDGKVFDPALVRFQKYPDFADDEYHHADEIARIESTDYTLNAQIRYATAWAREISMGYDPTGISVLNGPNYTLFGQHMFFQHGEFKGKDCLFGAARPDVKWVNYEREVTARAVFVAPWDDEMPLYRLGNPALYFKMRHHDLTDQVHDITHPDITREEILNRPLYLLAAQHYHDIEPLLEDLNFAPLHLIYDGVGFNRTVDAWTDFNKENHAGVVTLAADATVGQPDFEAQVLINQLKGKGGLHILIGFHKEWRHEIARQHDFFIDLDQLIRTTTGTDARAPKRDHVL